MRRADASESSCSSTSCWCSRSRRSRASSDPTWTRLVEGLAILAALWWAWVSYAWLANSAASDEGAARVVLLAAMGALLVTSLAVPKAFGDDALVFGLAYFGVRLLHLGSYLVVGRGDPELHRVVMRLGVTVVPATLALVVAGLVDGTARALCWALALALDYGGLAVRGVEGWRVEPAHFAERHGLIIIIALGESIVALGLGAQGHQLGADIAVAALLGMAVAGAMWWAYFDVAAIVAERRFRAMERVAQVRMARDSSTYESLTFLEREEVERLIAAVRPGDYEVLDRALYTLATCARASFAGFGG